MQSSPWLHAEPVRLSTTEFEPLTVLLGNRRVLTNVNCELSQPIWYQLKPITPQDLLTFARRRLGRRSYVGLFLRVVGGADAD